MSFPPSSANALYVRRLADLLTACPVGEMLTYKQLSESIGENVQEKFHLVHRAMKLANEEAGALFLNIKQSGYRRIPADDSKTVGRLYRLSIRRRAIRGNSLISNAIAKANDMSEAGRRLAFSEQATLGLLQHMTYSRNMKQISEGEPLPDLTKTVVDSVRAIREHLTGAGR